MGVGVNVWGVRLQTGWVIVYVVVLIVVVVGVGRPVVGLVSLLRVEIGEGVAVAALHGEVWRRRLVAVVVRVRERVLRKDWNGEKLCFEHNYNGVDRVVKYLDTLLKIRAIVVS